MSALIEDTKIGSGSLIVITGPSSSGKTGLSHALQEGLSGCFWRFSFDDYIEKLPLSVRKQQECIDEACLKAGYAAVEHAVEGGNAIFEGVVTIGLVEAFKRTSNIRKITSILMQANRGDIIQRESLRPNRDEDWINQGEAYTPNPIYDLILNSSRMTIDQEVEVVRRALS